MTTRGWWWEWKLSLHDYASRLVYTHFIFNSFGSYWLSSWCSWLGNCWKYGKFIINSTTINTNDESCFCICSIGMWWAANILFPVFIGAVGSAEGMWDNSNYGFILWTHHKDRCRETSQFIATSEPTQSRHLYFPQCKRLQVSFPGLS